MNEEKIGKSVKTLYIVTYSILIVVGIIWLALGALVKSAGDEEASALGLLLIILGVIFIALSVIYLIYFIRLPEYSITYKDGKLNFRNKLECTPAQLEYVLARGGGLDGAIFSFGKIVVSVNGKKYNFRFIQDAQFVANRLIELKKGMVMQTSAFGTAYQSAPMAAAPQTPAAPAVTESVEAVPEQTDAAEKEDNQGRE